MTPRSVLLRLVLSGAALLGATDTAHGNRTVVVLFTGLGGGSGVSGMDQLAGHLEARLGGAPGSPLSSQVFAHADQQAAFQFVSSFSDTACLVVIGHSFGGDSAIELETNFLAPAGLHADLLIQLDSVGIGDEDLPPGVGRGINYFQLSTGLFEPQGATAVSGSDNFGVEALYDVAASAITHTTIDCAMFALDAAEYAATCAARPDLHARIRGDVTVECGLAPCAGTQDDGLEQNDSCAAARPLGDGVYPGLLVFDSDRDYFRVTVPDQGTLTADVYFAHAAGDVDVFLYAAGAPACRANQGASGHGPAGSLVSGFSASDDESIAWNNTTGADADYVLEVSLWPSTVSDCNDYGLVLAGTTGGGSAITIACDPANAHTQGGPTRLDASSFAGPGALHLEATGGPAGEFGYFLVSSVLVDPGAAASNGVLCLGAPLGRYAPGRGGALDSLGRFDGFGVLQNLVGTSTVGSGYDVFAALPTPPGGSIASGSTWSFQLWYRDGQRSNFSNAVAATFP